MALVFTNKRDIRALSQLSELDKQQLRIAAREYDNEDHEDLAPLFADGAEWAFDVYRVDDNGTPLYDAWIINSDSGTLFRSGTADTADIGMIQGDIDGDADVDHLEELQRAFQAL